MPERNFEQPNIYEKNLETDGSFERPILDSEMTLEEAVNHPECPEEIKEKLSLVTVKYLGFDNSFHEGQIVVHEDLQKDVEDLFAMLMTLPEDQRFPVESVIPIVKFNWNDESSMSANNSSGFNYRKIVGTDRLSLHAYGFAIDLNPKLNPLVEEGEAPQPADGAYDIEQAGTLYEEHPVVKFMKERGWEWGGNWNDYQDYQHFQKRIES